MANEHISGSMFPVTSGSHFVQQNKVMFPSSVAVGCLKALAASHTGRRQAVTRTAQKYEDKHTVLGPCTWLAFTRYQQLDRVPFHLFKFMVHADTALRHALLSLYTGSACRTPPVCHGTANRPVVPTPAYTREGTTISSAPAMWNSSHHPPPPPPHSVPSGVPATIRRNVIYYSFASNYLLQDRNKTDLQTDIAKDSSGLGCSFKSKF
jgi:hypothetical protein